MISMKQFAASGVFSATSCPVPGNTKCFELRSVLAAAAASCGGVAESSDPLAMRIGTSLETGAPTDGGSAGTFRLTLSIAGAQATTTPTDPLSAPPGFTVPFTVVDYGIVTAGSVTAETPQRFFAIGGQQGDLIRVIMTRTSGDLVPRLRILNERSVELSRETQTRAGESIAYVTLPQTGWYLVEAGSSDGGTGGFRAGARTRAASARARRTCRRRRP